VSFPSAEPVDPDAAVAYLRLQMRAVLIIQLHGFKTFCEQFANSSTKLRFGTSQGAPAFSLQTRQERGWIDTREEANMLGWALVFLILALVAGYFGFVGLAGVAASIAQILFVIFLVLLVISFVARALRGGSVV
jgi:uncharacterized membrane protein YtjA (UPF0391 family)